MGAIPNFCGYCGEKLDADKDLAECPKCHSALHQHSEHTESHSRIVEQLPYKTPGTAALIAFVGGIFALPGAPNDEKFNGENLTVTIRELLLESATNNLLVDPILCTAIPIGLAGILITPFHFFDTST